MNDSLIGQQLGDYTIQSLLGQGGMARVYKGYDDKLDRYAAVKVIEPMLMVGDDEQEYRQRFQREARAIARLNHPYIVSVFQFGAIDTSYYMAMNFVEGRDLRQVLIDYNSRDERLAQAQVMRIVKDIASALDYAHTNGVIHRDVKPSNIMVMDDGHAVLTDFGLALNAQEGTIGNTFGSVHYIAPEQAVSSAQAVPQSDLYALGVVIYEMLTGRVPFEDVSAMSIALKHISDSPPLPSSINPEVTPGVEEVIMKTLDKEPTRRYESGEALVRALQGAFSADVLEKSDVELPVGTPPTSEKHTANTLILPKVPAPAAPSSMEYHPPAGSKTSKRPLTLIVLTVMAVLIVGMVGILAAGGGASNGRETPTATAVSTAVAVVEEKTPEVTPEPTATAVPINATSDDEAELLLRYDGRSIVVYNRLPNDYISLRGISFEQLNGAEFSYTDWVTGDIDNVRPGDCYQLWTVLYRRLPADQFPAEICVTRQGFNQTVHDFWVSDEAGKSFEVRWYGQRVATCQAAIQDAEEEYLCVVELS